MSTVNSWLGYGLSRFRNVGWPRVELAYFADSTLPQTVAVAPTCWFGLSSCQSCLLAPLLSLHGPDHRERGKRGDKSALHLVSPQTARCDFGKRRSQSGFIAYSLHNLLSAPGFETVAAQTSNAAGQEGGRAGV
jgi:hypothetical protein